MKMVQNLLREEADSNEGRRALLLPETGVKQRIRVKGGDGRRQRGGGGGGGRGGGGGGGGGGTRNKRGRLTLRIFL
jgi:hypothetical protein